MMSEEYFSFIISKKGKRTICEFWSELHRDRWIIDLLIRIIHRDLKIGDRSPELPGVERYSLSFVDESLFPELRKYPHDRFHVVLIHRAIGVVHIDPAADLVDIPVPLG